MEKILANYHYLQDLWPILKDYTTDQSTSARLAGVESKMKTYDFLYGNISRALHYLL